LKFQSKASVLEEVPIAKEAAAGCLYSELMEENGNCYHGPSRKVRDRSRSSYFSKAFFKISVPTAPVTVPAVTDPVEVQTREASVLEEVPIAKAAAGCPYIVN
jgi:hypothetical protein